MNQNSHPEEAKVEENLGEKEKGGPSITGQQTFPAKSHTVKIYNRLIL